MTRTITAIMFALMTITMTGMVLSCSRGTPPATDPVELGEAGTWNWVMSIGGIIGDTIYADSVDYTRQLVFDTVGNYSYTRDGLIESTGKYILRQSQSTRIFDYSDSQLPSDIITRIDTDTLVLTKTVLDGYVHTYAR